MITPEKIALAREVSFWHIFSDKTTDPKPGNMSIEEAEAILAEFERASEESVPTMLSVFYFPCDSIAARMGIAEPYMIGVTQSGQWYWLAPGESVPNQAEPEQFQGVEPLPYLFVRRPDLDDSYPMRCLMNDNEPDDFHLGDVVRTGFGHYGFALGLRLCPLVPPGEK